MPLLIRFKNKNLLTLYILITGLLISSILSAKPSPPSFVAQHSVFSRDGSQLIYVINNPHKEIIKQQLRTGKIIKRIPFKLAANASLLAPTPDGFKLLVAHAKGIDVIHNGTGKVLRTLPHPSGRYDWKGQAIKQNSDGSLLAIPSLRNATPKIYLIHTGSGKIIRTISLIQQDKHWNPYSSIGSFGFSHNKRLLAYTLYSNGKPTLHLYDISRQKALMSIDIPLTGYADTTDEMIHFNQNNTKIIISGINQKTIKLVDIVKKTASQLNYSYASFTSFSLDNKSLLIVQPYKKQLTFRNLSTGKQQQLKLPAIKKGYISNVIQSSNKVWLALPIWSNLRKEAKRFLLINTRTRKVLY
ncbi:MAG TPA: hypothetical protein ENJ51_11940 [Leucothrix mucor]|uniref:Uncharacterized protein n=1 Tax=Leucothrix mucor TaxID=45248 RepID=A0A7V2T1N1_LEUMU|nr:hypothetical protein [Leucothrix mucor]